MSAERILAERLLGRGVDRISLLSSGGNNRLYRIEAGASTFALKLYEADDPSGRQRFGRETTALRFLAATSLADRVPDLIAESEIDSAALFGWIEGVAPHEAGADEIAQMLGFLTDLRDLGTSPAARDLGEAAEACLSAGELVRQIDARRARFDEIVHELALDSYLGRFDRAWHRLRPALDRPADLLSSLRILSPSDFGLHNVLRRPNGRLAFLDFEYFGWDDPVKLTADIVWHPRMVLNEDRARAVTASLIRLFGRSDVGFPDRLMAAMPAYGLRWCLILLNEFLPERWARRRQAQNMAPEDWAAAKRRQLAKAEHMIARVEACRVEIVQ